MSQENKEIRLAFFQNCCNKLASEFKEISFVNGNGKGSSNTENASNYLDFIVKHLEKKNLIDDVEFVIDKDAALLINDNYWFLVENIVRKVISGGEQTANGELTIDVYKILSMTEFSVIASQPVVLVYSGDNNLTEGSELFNSLTVVERLVNGYFAWVCAYEFLTEWDSLKDLTSSKKSSEQKSIDNVWNDVLSFREDIPQRENSLTILVEHISIIANTTPLNYPIWTNSMWWRMLLYHIQNEVKPNI